MSFSIAEEEVGGVGIENLKGHYVAWNYYQTTQTPENDAFVAAYIHAAEKWNGQPQHCLDFSIAASQLKNSVAGDFNLVTEEEIIEQIPVRN